jgi:hypothetical protein
VLGKVADMQTEPTREPTASSVLAKLFAALRGDKYMAGAYPPEWQGAATAPDAERTKGR